MKRSMSRSTRRSMGLSASVAALVALAAMLLLAPSPSAAQIAAGAPASAQPRTYSAGEIALVGLINQYRANHGVSQLLLSDILGESAYKHNVDMATYHFFSHTTLASSYFPVGASPGNRMTLCGYPSGVHWGENIADGYMTVDSVFTAWKNSEPHRLNMLGSDWRVIGVSFYESSGSYWTTDFGSYVDGTAHSVGDPSPVDTTAPTLAITRPAAGADLSGRVSVEVSAADNVFVTRVELYGAGALVESDDSPPYEFRWDTASLTTGDYQLEARAYDSAGNVGSARIQVHVHNYSTSTTFPTTTTTLPSTTTTTAPPPSPTTTTVPAPTGFADVSPGSAYYASVSSLAGAGIISGCSDGQYHPERRVTRAQMAKMLVLGIGAHSDAIDNVGRPSFVDVPFNDAAYPFDYVEEAAALGIINGYGDGTFRPNGLITRAQATMMLARAGGESLDSPPPGTSFPFTDIPDYAHEAVSAALYNNLVSGKTPTTFDPYGGATRGQVADMVFRLRQVLGL